MGTAAAGNNAFLQLIFTRKIRPDYIAFAFGTGATLKISQQYLTIVWQNWLKKQLLYKIHLFSQTSLYANSYWIVTNGSRVALFTAPLLLAATAGGVLGAAIGIGISQTAFKDSGRDQAVKFYTGKVSSTSYIDTLILAFQELQRRHVTDHTHEPRDFSYSFGMGTNDEPDIGTDFPLGLGPGGPVF